MTNPEIEEFMRLWGRLARGNQKADESMSQLLQSFVDALSFQTKEIVEPDSVSDERGSYIFANVEHVELLIFPKDEALIFCIHCEFDEDALDLYSSIKTVIYGRELTGQPAAMLILKSNPTFDAYCDEAPVNLVRFTNNRIASVLRDKKPRAAFSSMLRESAAADVINPYTTAGPVVGSMFFGRRSELQMIINPSSTFTNGKRSFALLAARKSGKSSILLNAEKRFQQLNGVQVKYIDCYNYRTPESVMYEIATRLQPRAALRWSPEKFPHFLSLMDKKEYVLLLDEADVVAQNDSRSGGRLFSALAGASQFRFVVAGHLRLREEVRNHNARMFNIVQPIYLGRMEEAAGRNLIVDPIFDIGLELRDAKEIIAHILTQSACRPAIIQLYCYELVKRARQYGNNYLTIEDVRKVEINYAFRERVLDSFLIDTIPLSRLIGLVMLENTEEIMNEEQIYQAILAEGHSCQLSQVQNGIALLEEPGLIERELKGENLHFAFPAFPRLLRELHNPEFLKQETLKELKHDEQ